jgi:chemotaxis protein CheZ
MSDPLSRETLQHTPELMEELQDLTCNLRGALDRFRSDGRLNDLAEKEMPGARQRLSYVLKLTDEAAHRTLDLVEQAYPPALRTASEAAGLADLWARFRAHRITPQEFRLLVKRMDEFLSTARADSAMVRANLAEVRLAQGYQDLTGQAIRGVMILVAEVERTLAELTRLAGEPALPATPAAVANLRQARPAVPVDSNIAVVNDQDDVDELLSNLGM